MKFFHRAEKLTVNWKTNGYRLVKSKLGWTMWVPHHAVGVFNRKGVLDRESLRCIQDLFNECELSRETCLDVGANIGNHSIFFASIFKKVLSFEPLANELPTSQNLAFSGADNIVLFPIGLSDNKKTVDIYMSPSAGGGASTINASLARVNSTKKKIALDRGDALVGRQDKISLIKVDVEGHEAFALQGLRECILRDRPVILFEWNNPETRLGFESSEIFNGLLKNYCFVGIVGPLHRELFKGRLQRAAAKLVKLFIRKDYALVRFDPSKNFGNVLAVPKEARLLEEFFARRESALMR